MNKKFMILITISMFLLSACANAQVVVPEDWESPVYCFESREMSVLFSDAVNALDEYTFNTLINYAGTLKIEQTQDVKVLIDGSSSDIVEMPSQIKLLAGDLKSEECWLPQYFIEK